MRHITVILFLACALGGSLWGGEDFKDVVWKDAKELTLEGKAFADTKAPYDRLPASFRNRCGT